jgi:hypothetical protein
VREQRVGDGRADLAGRRDDRDLVDLVEALEAGACTGATVAAVYRPSRPPPPTCTGALSSFLSPVGLTSTLACSGAPTLTTKQREPPLLKKP